MRFPSFKKSALVSFGLAIVVGIFYALPFLTAPVSTRALQAAVRGLAVWHDLTGFGSASWMDAVAARLWRLGGPSALAWGEFVAVFGGWTLLAMGVFLFVCYAVVFLPKKSTRVGVMTLVGLALLGGAVWPFWRWVAGPGHPVDDVRLSVASELAEAVQGRSAVEVFASPTAAQALVLFTPETVGGIPVAEAGALAVNPPAWRAALRASAWKTVLLAGPVGEYRHLLDHLLRAPDWHLEKVTNLGFVFERTPGPSVASVDPETFRLGSDRATAVYLAQLAERYDAISRPAEARACLDRALDLAPHDVTVLSHAASFAAGRSDWQGTLAYSQRALAQDSGSTHAKLIRALAFLETGQPQQAQNLCAEVLAAAPTDLYTLFLYARIARQLNDAVIEADTLERLIAVSEKSGLRTVHYRIYLGQAYARQGLAAEALENYELVMASGTLNDEQATEIRDAIKAIKENAPAE